MKSILAIGAIALVTASTFALADAPAGKGTGEMRERIKAADTNGDGMISKAEAAALPRLAKHFDEIDTNHDGQVSPEEMRAFHKAHADARKVARGKATSPAADAK